GPGWTARKARQPSYWLRGRRMIRGGPCLLPGLFRSSPGESAGRRPPGGSGVKAGPPQVVLAELVPRYDNPLAVRAFKVGMRSVGIDDGPELRGGSGVGDS